MSHLTHTIRPIMSSNYPKPPTHMGLSFVEVADINIDAFDKQINTNLARASASLNREHVANLAQSLSEGWNDELGYPVAVYNHETGNPVLIDGHHRRDAWSSLGNTTLRCYYYKLTGICSIPDICRFFGIKLNDHPPALVNSKESVIRALVEHINEQELDLTKDEIKQLYVSLGLKNFKSTQVKAIVDKVYKLTNASQVRYATKEEVSKHIQQYPEQYGDIDHIAACTSGPVIDYAARNVNEILRVYNNTGQTQRIATYALKIEDAPSVYEARVTGLQKMKDLFDSFRDAAKSLKPGEYPWEVVGSYPQIPALEGDNMVEA